MNFRWFSLEEIYHEMIIEGNEKEQRNPRIPGGGKGSLSISHFCLVQILFNLPTGEKILRDGSIHWCVMQNSMNCTT